MLSPDAFEEKMRSVFVQLKETIPRLVVNVILQFNVSQIYDLTSEDEYCQRLRRYGTVFECSCAYLPGPLGPISRVIMDEAVQQYNLRLRKLYIEFQAHRSDSFALIVDPLLKNVNVKDWGLGAISRVDCFHPSLSTHEKLATGVWNNLFRPSIMKKGLSMNARMKCPYPWDRIWTV